MKLLLSVLSLWVAAAGADTFVGNGGGQGDVELAVTKKQISETFTAVKTRSQAEAQFCRCNPAFENRSVCEPLAVLTEAERGFCAQVMMKQAPEILKLLDGSGVIIRWTYAPIEVKDRGQIRAVDAVTDPERREITLNLKRFLAMAPFERVFLLTHELAHLTTYDGKPMKDEGSIGPFAGEEGGRRLLNAVGSAAAVMQGAYPEEIRKYKAMRHRSQSWKPFWVELSGGGATYTERPTQTFASKTYGRGNLGARFNLGDWGLVANFRTENNAFTALETIHVDEKVNIFGVGMSYRLFPFGDPLTFWGQSHFQVQATLDFVSAKIKLTENLTPPLEDSKTTTGYSVQVAYYLPIFWGLWGHMGMGLESHPYKYTKLNVTYDKPLTTTFLGVSYAF